MEGFEGAMMGFRFPRRAAGRGTFEKKAAENTEVCVGCTVPCLKQ